MHFYSLADFNSSNISFDNLSIISINARSISSFNKFYIFKEFIAAFKELPKIVIVQETWFESRLVNLYHLPGYTAVHCCRPDSYGGASVYISDKVAFSVLFNETSHCAEFIGLRLLEFNLNLVGYYRSPQCNIDVFIEFLRLKFAHLGNAPSMFLGDSNINLLENSMISKKFSNLCLSFNYNFCFQALRDHQVVAA